MMDGKVIRYGQDNIDTDVIIPGTYLKVHDYAELGRHAMEGLDPSFGEKTAAGGSVIVSGKNFGCGSSREHAPIALSESGIKAVLAVSFARIFYRNCVDGAFLLPIEIGQDAYDGIKDGDEISISLEENTVTVKSSSASFKTKPFAPLISEIISAGGLFAYGAAKR